MEDNDMRKLVVFLKGCGIDYHSKPWYHNHEQVGWKVGIPTYIIFYFNMREQFHSKLGFN